MIRRYTPSTLASLPLTLTLRDHNQQQRFYDLSFPLHPVLAGRGTANSGIFSAILPYSPKSARLSKRSRKMRTCSSQKSQECERGEISRYS